VLTVNFFATPIVEALATHPLVSHAGLPTSFLAQNVAKASLFQPHGSENREFEINFHSSSSFPKDTKDS